LVLHYCVYTTHLRAFPTRRSSDLPMHLLRAREAVMRHFRNSLREHHVTEQQWRVIRAISSSGEADVNDLVRLTFLLGPSLSRILDRKSTRLNSSHVKISNAVSCLK